MRKNEENQDGPTSETASWPGGHTPAGKEHVRGHPRGGVQSGPRACQARGRISNPLPLAESQGRGRFQAVSSTVESGKERSRGDLATYDREGAPRPGLEGTPDE